MKRLVFVLIQLWLSISCGIKEIGVAENPVKDGVWVSTEVSSEAESVQSCIVTAFSYPESFNWHDGDISKVKTSLVVFKDGVPLMRLAVGDGYQVSHDPDRHRFLGGHLYTDYPGNGEMVIKRDGSVILRYKGSERIVGMVVENGHIYTLGVPSHGEGLVFRKDGEPMITKHTGKVFERLEKDEDKICFAYMTTVMTEEGEESRYYMVRDGDEKLISLPQHMNDLMDVVSYSGETCCIISSPVSSSPYYYRDGTLRPLDIPKSSRLLYASFVEGTYPEPWIEGVYESPEGRTVCVLWIQGDEYMSIDNGLSVSYACSSESGFGCVMNPLSESTPGLLITNRMTDVMPEGYRCMGPRPMVMSGDKMYAGLSSTEGKRPLIWVNGYLDTLNINGHISTVSIMSP